MSQRSVCRRAVVVLLCVLSAPAAMLRAQAAPNTIPANTAVTFSAESPTTASIGEIAAAPVSPDDRAHMLKLAQQLALAPPARAEDAVPVVGESGASPGAATPVATPPAAPLQDPSESLPLGPKSAAGSGLGSPAVGGGSWGLKTAGALGIVIGLVLLLRTLLSKWSGRVSASGASGSSVLEVLTRVAVAPKNHILLLRLGGRVLVVSDSPAGMRTLANLDDPEEVAGLLTTLSAGKPNSSSRGFAQLLGRFHEEYPPAQQLEDQGADESEHQVGNARDQVSNLLSRLRSMGRHNGGQSP